MTSASSRRPLGRTGLQVGPLSVGTSPLASMSGLYGYDVPEEQAIATVGAVLDSTIGSIDTSNGYGEDGTAERRIGAALAARGGLPTGVLLATKVDPDPRTGDFSADRVRRSFEESLERLGVDRIELLHLHDPERIPFAEATGPGGALAGLIRLRDEGLVGHLGVAGGPVDVMQAYLDTKEFEVLLTHNRFTLLDRSAEDLFLRAKDAGIGVLNAAPFGGGILARGPGTWDRYAYGAADDLITTAAARMAQECAAFGIPLATAALQRSILAPFIDSTIVGLSRPERVAQTVAAAELDIPDALWERLDELIPPRTSWLDAH